MCGPRTYCSFRRFVENPGDFPPVPVPGNPTHDLTSNPKVKDCASILCGRDPASGHARHVPSIHKDKPHSNELIRSNMCNRPIPEGERKQLVITRYSVVLVIGYSTLFHRREALGCRIHPSSCACGVSGEASRVDPVLNRKYYMRKPFHTHAHGGAWQILHLAS